MWRFSSQILTASQRKQENNRDDIAHNGERKVFSDPELDISVKYKQRNKSRRHH